MSIDTTIVLNTLTSLSTTLSLYWLVIICFNLLSIVLIDLFVKEKWLLDYTRTTYTFLEFCLISPLLFLAILILGVWMIYETLCKFFSWLKKPII